MKVALLGEAWDIVQRQPKKSEFIFPYNSTSVTAGFQRVRSKLGIKICDTMICVEKGQVAYLRLVLVLRKSLRLQGIVH